jgi:hypothetical protein
MLFKELKEKIKQLESWFFHKRKKNTQKNTNILKGLGGNQLFVDFCFFEKGEPNAWKKQGMSMLVNNKLQAK